MSRILDLKEKRADIWAKAKKLLDEYDGKIMSGEALENYEKMEKDMDNISRQIEALERAAAFDDKMNNPANNPILDNPQGMPSSKPTATKEYKNAFSNFLRCKDTTLDIRNALSVGTNTEGGYLVPEEFEQQIISGLQEQNIIRLFATPIQTSSDRKIPIAGTHGTASWVEEGGEVTDSDESFGQKTLSAFALATSIKVSEELIADSAFNLELYIAQEFARRIATAEEEAFIVGDGSNKPTGIFAETGGGDIGVTTASTTAITADEIIDLYYSLKSPYRKNAVWIMGDSTIKAIRQLKDSNGQYMWQPSLQAGTPDTILGRAVYTSEHCPNISTGNKPIAFGDFSYYWIADRQGRSFKRLNELYAKTRQVGFIGSERVDGKLLLSEAVKVMKIQ